MSDEVNSRSQQKRIAALKGEPYPAKVSDEQIARELVARYDQRCAAIRKLDPAWLRHETAALLARRALEARNEALEEAVQLVGKFTNPLVVAEKLSWLESPMTFARVMEVILAEIRTLAASPAARAEHPKETK